MTEMKQQRRKGFFFWGVGGWWKSDKFDRRAGLARLPIPLLLQSGLDGEPKAAKAERGWGGGGGWI